MLSMHKCKYINVLNTKNAIRVNTVVKSRFLFLNVCPCTKTFSELLCAHILYMASKMMCLLRERTVSNPGGSRLLLLQFRDPHGYPACDLPILFFL